MKKKVNLKFACPLPWENLLELSGTERFCNSCKKKVIDFSKEDNPNTSDAQCGRFKLTQVERISKTLPLSQTGVIVFSFATLLGLAPLTSSAQERINQPTQRIDTLKAFRFHGLVRDSISRETIPFANVTVFNAQGEVIGGGPTDINGLFDFEIPLKGSDLRNLVVQFSFTGYKKKAIDSNRLLCEGGLVEVELKPDPDSLNDVIILGGYDPFTRDNFKHSNTFSNEEHKTNYRQ